MTDKTFILCVGASKCGTTWIRDYLGSSPGADMGRLGEMQVWDALTVPVFAKYRVPEPSRWRQWEDRAAQALGWAPKADVLRWRLQSDVNVYFAYFQRLLAKPGIHLTGDVTPTYAALPVPILQRIDDRFTAAGITVKVVFIMRDPIERAWSLVKMKQRKGETAQAPREQLFRAQFGDQPLAPHHAYGPTLARLNAVFEPERVFLGLYETLFEPETIAAFSAFAGVPSRPEAGGKRVNAAGDSSGVPEALAAEVYPNFASDYAAAFTAVPQARTLWRHARAAEASVK